MLLSGEAGRAAGGEQLRSFEIWNGDTRERGLVRKGQPSSIKGLP